MPRTTTVYLLLGSNVEPIAHLTQAVRLLENACDVLAVSSLYRTTAQGTAKGGADYYNVAVNVSASQPPTEFKVDVCRAIEHRLGRSRDAASDRSRVPIDIDIALWGTKPISYGDKPWRSPSPDIARYAYVAIPLAEIAPDIIHPDLGATLAEVAARFPPGDVIRLGPLPR